MNARKAERLRALLLPVIDQLPLAEAEREQVRALLTPDTFVWPHEPPPPCFGIAREEWPLQHLNADYGRAD